MCFLWLLAESANMMSQSPCYLPLSAPLSSLCQLIARPQSVHLVGNSSTYAPMLEVLLSSLCRSECISRSLWHAAAKDPFRFDSKTTLPAMSEAPLRFSVAADILRNLPKSACLFRKSICIPVLVIFTDELVALSSFRLGHSLVPGPSGLPFLIR